MRWKKSYSKYNISIQCVCIYLCMYIYIFTIIIVYIYIYIYTVIYMYMYIYISRIEFQGGRCDPNSVGYKNYSQAWGYRMGLLSSIFSQNGLSYKMPSHFQQPWKTDELEYCHILSLRNARLFWKTLHWGTHFPYKMPLLFFKAKVWTMFFCYKIPIWFW